MQHLRQLVVNQNFTTSAQSVRLEGMLVFFLCFAAVQAYSLPPRTWKTKDRICLWESLHRDVKHSVMDRFFDAPILNDQSCEIFTIEGVPAASITYTNTTNNGHPVVDEFHLNMGLLMMFDAGPKMRKLMYHRYSCLDMEHAKNRNKFLSI